MGSSEIDSLLPEGYKSSIEPLTLAEQLDEWCAFYMAIGVPYEEFWYGDYCRLKYYVESHNYKKKMQNEMLWLQGMYDFDAFGTVMSRFGASLSGKRSKAQYAQKPYDVVEKSEREKALEIEEKRKRVIANLSAVANAWKAKKDAEDSRTDNRDKE